jgi:DNA polymerase-3 subunit chi
VAVILFYHLTRSTEEQTLRTILDRAMGQGWRVMIRGTDMSALQRLDARLWQHPADGFIAHALEGGQDGDQPVLLGLGPIGNAARGLILLEGAATDPVEVGSLDRVWVLFDGADPGRLVDARRQWKALTDAGQPAQYWSEDSGKWEKKAEKG